MLVWWEKHRVKIYSFLPRIMWKKESFRVCVAKKDRRALIFLLSVGPGFRQVLTLLCFFLIEVFKRASSNSMVDCRAKFELATYFPFTLSTTGEGFIFLKEIFSLLIS